jgi:hypothetical protein
VLFAHRLEIGIINSVIVDSIRHILRAIYWNSNEFYGGTSCCNGGILLGIHNFHWSHTSTEGEDLVAVGNYQNLYEENCNLWLYLTSTAGVCRKFISVTHKNVYYNRSIIETKFLGEK